MKNQLIAKFLALKALSIVYDALIGISCPLCEAKAITTSTRNEGIATIRFHRCIRCGWTFKSIEKHLTCQKKKKAQKGRQAQPTCT